MNRLIDFKSRFRILKGGKISLMVSALLGSVVIASAAPIGATVTSGTANISENGNVTNINQSTQKASINWNNFSIKSNETVNFNQPNVNSITLNRVIGNEKSVIDGALNANGQVWILNSNGILFNKSAKINAAGLLATTAQLSDKDFQDGNYNFKNSSKNSVINLGTIEVSNNAYVVLASNEVKNNGTIKAVKGKVHLVGADSYSLNLNGNSIVNLVVDKGVLDALVENSGTIIADGGDIYLTTNAVNELLKGVVNNTGIIEANSLDGLTGKVELFAHGGTAQIDGTIEAIGGFVETSGKDFSIDSNAKIRTKNWLIDPSDLYITDATAYETSLNGGANVTIQVGSGSLYVNDTITWNSANTLTLDSYYNIYINKSITATNAAGKLALYYGQGTGANGNTAKYSFGLTNDGFTGNINLQSGNNYITKLGNDATETTWTVINDYSSLSNIQSSGKYALGSNIDATLMSHRPIWNSASLDGLGHTINNLTGMDSFMGGSLFQFINSGDIVKNIGLININNPGSMMDGTGGIAAYNNGIIDSVYVTGNIGSQDSHHAFRFGGIAGSNSGTISNSFSNASVYGEFEVGGIAGNNSGTISNSYSLGTVNGMVDTGGIVGVLSGGSISNSYSAAQVFGGNGLAGNIAGGTITGSFYDKTVNPNMSDEVSYGKTTTEMQTLSTYTNADWNIIGNDGAYPIFSTTGTSVWSMNEISPEPTPTPEPTVIPTLTVLPTVPTPNPTPIQNNTDVNKVITAIVNTNVLKVEIPRMVPPVIQPQVVKTTMTPTIDMGFGKGANVSLVSQPQDNEPTKMITMTQLKSMQKNDESQETNTNGVNDVRVSVGNNSVIDLLNGGVNLPDGVEQEFYVVKDKKN